MEFPRAKSHARDGCYVSLPSFPTAMGTVSSEAISNLARVRFLTHVLVLFSTCNTCTILLAEDRGIIARLF